MIYFDEIFVAVEGGDLFLDFFSFGFEVRYFFVVGY